MKREEKTTFEFFGFEIEKEKLFLGSLYAFIFIPIIAVSIWGINKTLKDIEEKRLIKKTKHISFMEKLGTGIILGKNFRDNKPEIAIQFKDTILYSNNKEWYYLLKEGDSIQVINGKLNKINN